MTEDLLAKAKEAQSPEELLTLVQENGMDDFTQEEAESLYAQLHTTGELTDEEMEAVTGGAHTTVNGQKYKVVSSGTSCFTGKYEYVAVADYNEHGTGIGSHLLRTDHTDLRNTWRFFAAFTDNPSCGKCIHLGFTKALTGYCEVEHDS